MLVLGVNSLLLYVNCSIRIHVKSQAHIHQFAIDLRNFKMHHNYSECAEEEGSTTTEDC